jgi:hypothetical protein
VKLIAIALDGALAIHNRIHVSKEHHFKINHTAIEQKGIAPKRTFDIAKAEVLVKEMDQGGRHIHVLAFDGL